jgi:hypothetical protein
MFSAPPGNNEHPGPARAELTRAGASLNLPLPDTSLSSGIPLAHGRISRDPPGNTSRVLSPAASPYCIIIFPPGSVLPGTAFHRASISLLAAGVLLLADVVAGAPLGFLTEGARIGGHGPGQGAVARLDAEVAGKVFLAVPGPRADRGRLGGVEDGGVASSMPRSTRRYSSGVFPSKTRPAALLAPRPSSSALAMGGAGPRSGGGPPARSAAQRTW